MKGRSEREGEGVDEKNRCNEQRFGWQPRRMDVVHNRPLLQEMIYLSHQHRKILSVWPSHYNYILLQWLHGSEGLIPIIKCVTEYLFLLALWHRINLSTAEYSTA